MIGMGKKKTRRDCMGLAWVGSIRERDICI